jgi:N-acetylglutamate synthase-like GNAT family acetyltransferase
VVACGRLQKNTEQLGQIRFMAVADAYQGKGYGKKILEALEKKARLQQLRVIELQARENALEFYLRCGYQKIEATFKLWDLIQHYRMRRHINSEILV